MNNAQNNPWAEVRRLEAENERLRAKADGLLKIEANLRLEAARVKGQLADANEIARQAVEQAKAAKKVVDGAIKWQMTGTYEEHVRFSDLVHVIAEYRVLTEPISPRIAAAVERGLEKVERVETMQETN